MCCFDWYCVLLVYCGDCFGVQLYFAECDFGWLWIRVGLRLGFSVFGFGWVGFGSLGFELACCLVFLGFVCDVCFCCVWVLDGFWVGSICWIV